MADLFVNRITVTEVHPDKYYVKKIFFTHLCISIPHYYSIIFSYTKLKDANRLIKCLHNYHYVCILVIVDQVMLVAVIWHHGGARFGLRLYPLNLIRIMPAKGMCAEPVFPPTFTPLRIKVITLSRSLMIHTTAKQEIIS
jgi:hypothetical protein